MPCAPAVLMTDWLVYLLLAASGVFAAVAARREHLRAPWRQVKRRPLAMAALAVLSAYIVVGLLDSVHFRPYDTAAAAGTAQTQRCSNEVVSLLDVLVGPLRLHEERTYSAPFALYGFTKETMPAPDGGTTRAYPRLAYGGAHLKSVDQRAGDVARRAGAAFVQALFLWAILAGAAVLWQARGRRVQLGTVLAQMRRGETGTPWRTVLATAGLLLYAVTLAANLAPHYHIFGTDQVGVDVFYRSLKSIRTGLLIGTLTTLVMLPFAILLGIMAGYFRGWIDDVIQYLYTTLSSIPSVLLIAAAVLSIQVYMANHPESFETLIVRSDMRLLFLCLILGVTSWTTLCRLLRGETLKIREVDYVRAATALGVRPFPIMLRHIFPNVMHIVLITVVLDFSGLVLAEAVLSYIGVGVDPTMNSWGNMINGARLEMAREPMVWWSLLAAFVFMFGLVLAANVFSDAVRDAFDPRLRRR